MPTISCEEPDDSMDMFESAPQLGCFHHDWLTKGLIAKVPWN
jgi:hypothetical protein